MAKKTKHMAQQLTIDPPATDTTGTTQTAEAPSRAPSSAMLKLFSGTSAINLAGVTRLNNPKMIEPKDFPIGQVLQGRIVKNIQSPVKTIKGRLLWLMLPSGQEFTFPVTGTVRTALCGNDELTGPELERSLNKYNDKVIILRRSPDGRSKQYQRNVYMFEVFVSDDFIVENPVDESEQTE